MFFLFLLYGEDTEIRTQDSQIKSLVFYQLNYILIKEGRTHPYLLRKLRRNFPHFTLYIYYIIIFYNFQ